MNYSKTRNHFLFSFAIISVACLNCASLIAQEIKLTNDGRFKRDVIVLANGESVVYGVQESEILVRQMKLNLETKEEVPLHSDATKNALEPSFSKDGVWQAFVNNKGNLELEIFIRNTKENKQYVVGHKGRGGYTRPLINPDATRVIYCFAETGPQQIHSVNMQGEDKKTLTDGQGVCNWPTFTPDGKQIVFTSARTGTYELYIMDADGKNVKQLTDNNFMELRPRVSPDGKNIVFVSNFDGNREVYISDLQCKKIHRLTNSPERDDFPAWTPDGKNVIFISERLGEFDLYQTRVPEKFLAK